jgi:hypothetical protein
LRLDYRSVRLLSRVIGNELDNDLRELFAFIFLQEVTSVGNGDMWLVSCTRDISHEWLLAACGDRVLIAECAQERFLKLA